MSNNYKNELFVPNAEAVVLAYLALFPHKKNMIDPEWLSDNYKSIYNEIVKRKQIVRRSELLPLCKKTLDNEAFNNVFKDHKDEDPDEAYAEIKKAYLVRKAYKQNRHDIVDKYISEDTTNPEETIVRFSEKFNKTDPEYIYKELERENEFLKSFNKVDLTPMKASELPGANDKIDYIIDNWMEKDSFNSIIGSAKTGKTQLALMMAFAVQNGLKFLGDTCHKADVLYVDFEMKPKQINDRIKSLKKFYNLQESDEPYFMSVAQDFANEKITLEQILEAVRIAKKDNPNIKLCIFDCYYSFAKGDANSEEDTKENLKKLKALVDDMAVCYVHHTNKTGMKSIQDMIYAAGGSGVHGKIVDNTYVIWPKKKNFNVGRTGRSFGTKYFECVKDESTYYSFKRVDEMPNRFLSVEETLLELEKAHPDLYKFIGDEGSTLYKVQQKFPRETQKTLTQKGFLCTKKKIILIPTEENLVLYNDEKRSKK